MFSLRSSAGSSLEQLAGASLRIERWLNDDEARTPLVGQHVEPVLRATEQPVQSSRQVAGEQCPADASEPYVIDRQTAGIVREVRDAHR